MRKCTLLNRKGQQESTVNWHIMTHSALLDSVGRQSHFSMGESKFEIFGSTCHFFVRRRKGERMVSTCMAPTVKHGGGGVMMWGCFAGDTVGDLFKIEGTLNQHGYYSILQRHAIPSGLCLVGPLFIFEQDNDPKHISRLCKGYLTKKEWWVLCQMTRPPQTPKQWPKPNRDGLGWDEPQSEGKRANKCSAFLGTPSRLFENHFRWLPHEAHWENAKSVQSSNQSKGCLF